MAEGLLRHDGGERFDVQSAGTIKTFVRPQAIEAMREIGIDITDQYSKSVDEFLGQEFDYVITVCDDANASCPVFPGATRRIHWSIDDPAFAGENDEQRLAALGRARDEIREHLREFIAAQ
jgi:arsenate reductase